MESGIEALDASLPGSLPVFPGLAVTGRYVLTDQAPTQRGDGLKSIALPGARVGVMVCDVVGHGAAASTSMSRLMAILRDRLEEGGTPAAAMHAADRYAASAPFASGATMAIAVVSLDDGSVDYAGAGHPAPLHVRADGTVLPVALAPSRPLGTGGVPATATGRLDRGDLLILHTDGLLTAAGGAIDDGRRRLIDVLGRFRSDPAPRRAGEQSLGDDLCQAILAGMPSHTGYLDDVSLVVVQPTARPLPFETTRCATPDDIAQLGRDFEAWLDGLEAGLLDHIALRHAFAEVATNVVEHAYPQQAVDHPRLVHVSAVLGDEGALQVTIRDDGRWRAQSAASGRGLVIAGGLVDSMTLTRTRAGTQVVLRQRLGRPVPVLRASMTGPRGPERRGPRAASVPMASWIAADTLHFSGAVTEGATNEFLTRVHEVTRAGTLDAVIDLEAVSHLSSAPVRVLFDYLDRAKVSGARLVLVASVGSVAHQVLEMVSLPHRSATSSAS